ncbi:hypothetical protein FXW78_17965 [Rhodococcus opacus]|nr:hypothetical protein [Rhodococcus opacus]
MRIVVHRTPGEPQIRLEDADEFGSLRIEPADPEHSISAGDLAFLGRPSGEQHVFVDPGAIRALAGAQASDESWSAGFDAMVAYADSRGWLNPAGEIRVHIAPCE